ncbi:hypothetical protein PIB30_088921 [Stylosanthes scabra]|uniref:DUF4283 domain-containing protein n=1 Tax=Stylosanthes scabra TaxID=79078 RepID=A0ABU6TW33_9FABA|nr:hypothetical protein [Stylosanthes scabra]
MDVGFDYFLVKCDLLENREKILLGGPWKLGGYYFAVKPWILALGHVKNLSAQRQCGCFGLADCLKCGGKQPAMNEKREESPTIVDTKAAEEHRESPSETIQIPFEFGKNPSISDGNKENEGSSEESMPIVTSNGINDEQEKEWTKVISKKKGESVSQRVDPSSSKPKCTMSKPNQNRNFGLKQGAIKATTS